MKVRITRGHIGAWYEHSVGDVFEVNMEAPTGYFKRADDCYQKIRKHDCEVIDDDGNPEGIKHDDGKPDWTLLPIKPLITVIRVLEHGLDKYGRDNWKSVSEAKHRYLKAAFRHIVAISDGEWVDAESKLPHAAHAVCCLLFLLWFGQ